MSDQSVSSQKSETLGSDTVRERETLVTGLCGLGQPGDQPVDFNFCEPRSKKLEISQESEVSCLNCLNQETPDRNLAVEEARNPMGDLSGKMEGQEDHVSFTQVGKREREEIQEMNGVEGMDVDEGSTEVAGFGFFEPCFLGRVLRDEFGNHGGDHKLLIIAIHAVLLESGFVGFDSVSGIRVDGLNLPEEWPSEAFVLPLWYTLPELLGKDNVAESVVLKFQKFGHFLHFDGYCAKNCTALCGLCLDEYRFAPTIDLVRASCDKNYTVNGDNGLTRLYPENEVFEFWKIVKDGLALPLLIDLCERAGVGLPACLIRLPTELKLKILELLPATDIARIGCVCLEMRSIASNNDLWKQKFVEEFGSGTEAQRTNNWKVKYASRRESRKKYWESRKKWIREMQQRPWAQVLGTSYFPFSPGPFPYRASAPMIGEDYDYLPGFPVSSLFRHRRLPCLPYTASRSFIISLASNEVELFTEL